MKVCAKCGVEIDGLDGDNLCRDCASGRKRAKRRAQRRERDSIMESMGLVKVKGALGGVYWE